MKRNVLILCIIICVITPHFEEAPKPSGMQIRRRLQKEWLQITGQSFEFIIYANKGLRILRRKTTQFGDSSIAIGPPWEHMAVGKGNLQSRIAWNHAKPM